MSRYIIKVVYLEKPKQPIYWNGGSRSLVKVGLETAYCILEQKQALSVSVRSKKKEKC